jgi:hypothetical protein
MIKEQLEMCSNKEGFSFLIEDKKKYEIELLVLELLHTHLGFPFPKVFPYLLVIIQSPIF